MTVPITLFTHIGINWVIPEEITYPAYDTVNIYSSNIETHEYTLHASIPALDSNQKFITSYEDLSVDITAKNSISYVVIFSNAATGAYSKTYLAYKSLTPREQRMILQLRDYLSRFITNRLADEEIRQYIEQGINIFNTYAPTTTFTIFSLPKYLEPLVLLGSLILGLSYNYLGIAFTDIAYNDQGFNLTTDRSSKMSTIFDKVTKMYNELVTMAKFEYAPYGVGVGTVSLPIGMGGNLGRNILSILDILNSTGR